jgi:hypothetical protein
MLSITLFRWQEGGYRYILMKHVRCFLILEPFGSKLGLNTNPAGFALDLITVDLQQVSKDTEGRERGGPTRP